MSFSATILLKFYTTGNSYRINWNTPPGLIFRGVPFRVQKDIPSPSTTIQCNGLIIEMGLSTGLGMYSNYCAIYKTKHRASHRVLSHAVHLGVDNERALISLLKSMYEKLTEAKKF